MTIQEAINRVKEVAERNRKCNENKECVDITCEKCAEEHEQLLEWLKELQQYRVIGTVEECREARERQRVKKPKIITGKTEKDKLACCPICESNLDWTYDGFWRKGNPKHCSNCGQAIDWNYTSRPTK